MRSVVWIALAVVAVGVGAYLGFQPERARTVAFWAWVSAPTILLAAVGVLHAHRDRTLSSWLTPRWGDFTIGFLGAAVLFAGAVLGAKLLFLPESDQRIWLQSLYLQVGSPEELQPRAALVAAAILISAAAEEILWRGWVTQLLAERMGSRFAWVAAAVLYALANLPAMFAMKLGDRLNPLVPLGALVCGLAWGGMTRYFRRVTPAILSHALFDWCIVMMFPLWSMKSG